MKKSLRSYVSLTLITLFVGAQLANAQTDPLTAFYEQQSAIVRGLVDGLDSTSDQRQLFNLWMLELNLANSADIETSSEPFMLEEAIAAGALAALDAVAASDNPEAADTASTLRARLTESLGLNQNANRARSILNGSSTEALGAGQYDQWLGLELRAGTEYRVRSNGCGLIKVLVLAEDDQALIEGGAFMNTGFMFTSQINESALMRVRTFQCQSQSGITISSGAPTQTISSASSADDAYAVSVGRYLGRLTNSERQWMSLEINAGQSLRFEATPQTSLLDTYITLYDQHGMVLLAEDDDGGIGLGSSLEYTSPGPIEALLEVRRLDQDAGDYELVISELLPPAERGRSVEIGNQVLGDLTAVAREWWRFEPTPGVRYRIEALPNNGLLDTYVTAYATDGMTVIGEDDDGAGGLGSRLDFTAMTNRPVLVEVHRLDEDTGRYNFRISEHEISFDHQEPAVGIGRHRGNVAADGESWWRLDAPAGRYEVELIPYGEVDSLITLFDADATTELASDDDGGQGLGSRLQFTTPANTTRVLRVVTLGDGGDFDLVVSEIPHPGQIAEPAEMGGVYAADIRPYGERWWRLETRAGTSYDLEATPTGELDTLMALYTEDAATELDSDDDGGQELGSRIQYRADSNGALLIKVSGLGDSSGTFDFFVR